MSESGSRISRAILQSYFGGPVDMTVSVKTEGATNALLYIIDTTWETQRNRPRQDSYAGHDWTGNRHFVSAWFPVTVIGG